MDQLLSGPLCGALFLILDKSLCLSRPVCLPTCTVGTILACTSKDVLRRM